MSANKSSFNPGVFDPEISLPQMEAPEPGDVQAWNTFERESQRREEMARQLSPLIGFLAAEGPKPDGLGDEEYWRTYGPSRDMAWRVSDIVFDTMQQRGRAHVAHMEKLDQVGPAGITPQPLSAAQYDLELTALDKQHGAIEVRMLAAQAQGSSSRVHGRSQAEQNYWDGVARLYQEELYRLKSARNKALGDRHQAQLRERRAQQAAREAEQARTRTTYAPPRPSYANSTTRSYQQPLTFSSAFNLQHVRMYGHGSSDPMNELTSAAIWARMGLRDRAQFLRGLGYTRDQAAEIMKTGAPAPDDQDGRIARGL